MSTRRRTRSFKGRSYRGTTARGRRVGRGRAQYRSLQRMSRFDRAMVIKKDIGLLDSAPTGIAIAMALDSQPLSTNVHLLNALPQGVALGERVGRKVALKSLNIRGCASPGPGNNISQGVAFLVYDKHPVSALPNITTILEGAGPYAASSSIHKERFTVLRRWPMAFVGDPTPQIPPAYGTGNITWCHQFNHFIDLKGLPTVYKASGTGGIGDIESGALYLVTTGDAPPGPAAPSLAFNARLRFVDN